MTSARDLITIARLNHDMRSDADLAGRLGIGVGSISAWRLGRQPIPDARVVALCKLADERPALWFAILAREAATDPDVKAAWSDALAAIRKTL